MDPNNNDFTFNDEYPCQEIGIENQATHHHLVPKRLNHQICTEIFLFHWLAVSKIRIR